jgi:uncharacterized protein (TIGR00369 family)
MTVETEPADAAGADQPTGAAELLAQLNTHRGELAEKLGIELLEATPERVVGRMPVEGNRQPYGLLHGGASVALAETVGSIAAMLSAGPGRAAVGLDINATHHRALTAGTVTGVATRIHGGRSAAMFDIRITDEQGRPVCTSRLTCMLRDQPPAGGKVPGA